jgi:hypothetical protein
MHAVATVVMTQVILQTPQRHECGHCDDQLPAWAQNARQFFERGFVVLDMFNHVRSKDTVEFVILKRKSGAIRNHDFHTSLLAGEFSRIRIQLDTNYVREAETGQEA